MNGKNTLVYGKHLFSERQMDPDDINLMPCRVETAIGCAWINFDDDAPSLRDSIGPLIDRLEAHNVHKLKAEWWVGTVLPANWKIAMEAFMEGYHVMTTHPQLQDIVPQLYDAMYKFPRKEQFEMIDPAKSLRENVDQQLESMLRLSVGMDGMLHKKELEIARSLADVDNLGVEFPEDKNQAMMMWLGVVQDQISKRLQAKGEPVPDLNTVCQTDPINAVEFLFPHYFLLPYFSSFSAYRIRPLGPEIVFLRAVVADHLPGRQRPRSADGADDPALRQREVPADPAAGLFEHPAQPDRAARQGLRVHAPGEGRRRHGQQFPPPGRWLSGRRAGGEAGTGEPDARRQFRRTDQGIRVLEHRAQLWVAVFRKERSGSRNRANDRGAMNDEVSAC